MAEDFENAVGQHQATACVTCGGTVHICVEEGDDPKADWQCGRCGKTPLAQVVVAESGQIPS